MKDFADPHKELKLCFYPSTLRMINLSNDPALDNLFSGIEKLLVYNLDSAAHADKSHKELIDIYRELNYEEYISTYGKDIDFFIYGKESRRHTEYIGVIAERNSATVFYLRGFVAFNKLPELIQSMNDGNIINPLDFNISDFGKHTQDQ